MNKKLPSVISGYIHCYCLAHNVFKSLQFQSMKLWRNYFGSGVYQLLPLNVLVKIRTSVYLIHTSSYIPCSSALKSLIKNVNFIFQCLGNSFLSVKMFVRLGWLQKNERNRWIFHSFKTEDKRLIEKRSVKCKCHCFNWVEVLIYQVIGKTTFF